MMKYLKRVLIVVMVFSLMSPLTVSAANKFSFSFTDLKNHEYPTSWSKENTSNAYTITLNRYNGLKANTMSSSNVFGCRMKDMSVGPTVDVYHTFSNYVSNYAIGYISSVYKGDTMVLGGKKDDSSTSSATLNISGTIIP